MVDEANPIGNARGAIGAVGDVMRIASENPDAKDAGAIAGKSLKIISQTIHSALLPLAVVNYGVEKFATYMREKFEPELESRLAGVPPEHLQRPRPTVAGPAIQALVYAYEEEEVRALFLELLAASMDDRRSAEVHPAFVDIVRQLDPNEVPLLHELLAGGRAIPLAEIRSQKRAYKVLYRNLTTHRRVNPIPASRETLPAFIDNWERLGLVKTSYEAWFSAETAYDWVEKHPIMAEFQQGFPDATFGRGTLAITAWGSQFSKAIGPLPD